MARHTLLELSLGQLLDQLREDGAAGIHAPLSPSRRRLPRRYLRLPQFKSFPPAAPPILLIPRDLSPSPQVFPGH